VKQVQALDDDYPVIMLNLLKFKPDGGQQAYARYGQVAVQRVMELGGQILFAGAAHEVDGVPNEWDQIALVKYPSRRAFTRLEESEAYRKAEQHRSDGLEKTVLYAFNEIGPAMGGVTSPGLVEAFTVDKAPSADAVYMLNLLRFKKDGGEDKYFSDYIAKADPIVQKLGGKIAYSLKGELGIIGGEETIDRLLLVSWPNQTAFFSLVQSEEYQKVAHLRTEAIEMGMLLPFANNTPDLPGMRRASDAQQQRGGRNRSMVQMITRLDQNGDGKLQKSELPERMQSFFDTIDGNGDGAIDEAEAKAVDAQRGRR
jgi:uncharacterized protein (DUF1330 family)